MSAAPKNSERTGKTSGGVPACEKLTEDNRPPAVSDPEEISLASSGNGSRAPAGRTALFEVFLLWAASFLVIVIFRAVPVISAYAKAAAAIAFLYLPGMVIWKRGEDYRDYGADFFEWKKDVRLGLLACTAVLPAFAIAFAGFAALLPSIPEDIRVLLGPYGTAADPALRLPARFWEHVLDQFLAVALPEELFYRGFIQTRLKAVWPSGRRALGIEIGPAFWMTALLFALGHLAVLQPWRLSVFFPALAFGWLRERSGSILPCVIFHAASNLALFILEASFFGIRL